MKLSNAASIHPMQRAAPHNISRSLSLMRKDIRPGMQEGRHPGRQRAREREREREGRLPADREMESFYEENGDDTPVKPSGPTSKRTKA